jgi:hypothetical protein
MRAAFKKRTGSRRDLEKSIDPKMPVVEAVDGVLTGLKTAGLGPNRDRASSAKRGGGVLTLCRTVRWLNRMPLWEFLTIPRGQRNHGPQTPYRNNAANCWLPPAKTSKVGTSRARTSWRR